jgi:uncharacterized protein YecE (DUF72 family)
MIGPAGWSYEDWEGIVYPPKPQKGFHGATYLAEFFGTVEVNSSFYGSPTAGTVRSWVQRISPNPHFRFTAKLWRGFTMSGTPLRRMRKRSRKAWTCSPAPAALAPCWCSCSLSAFDL